jgi:hypothetical protein
MTPGYSGTPLAHRLGLKPGIRCWFHNMPAPVRAELDPEGSSIEEQPTASDGLHCALLFVTEAARLEQVLSAVCPLLQINGFVWVAWPGSGSALSEALVRGIARPLGLTDAEACVIDDAWAAIKLVIRRASR